MGCCISTTKSCNQEGTPSKYNNQLKTDVKCRSPPPVIEEETVKEVLSVTPIYKPPQKNPLKTAVVAAMYNRPATVELPVILPEVLRKTEQIDMMRPTKEEISVVSEMSGASEMCSFSGSFCTTVFTDRDEGEVTQQVIPRSPAMTPNKRPYSVGMQKDRGLGSPVRRSAPSPVKRTQVRSSLSQARTKVARRLNVGPINERDSGPVQRSRSPAPPGEVVLRCDTGYKLPSSSTQGQLDLQSPARNGQASGHLMDVNHDVSADSSESLVNISLECFIFL